MTSTFPPLTCRLICHDLADGATNMAIDEAILAAVREGTSPPTLRFYAWSPPCLTLGRGQPLADADLDVCRADGIDVVRRPTGGSAILHTDELTYSFAILQDDPRAAGGVLESYRRFSRGLLAGLQNLGVEAIQASDRPKGRKETTAVCFETPSDYEITAQGRKLVGSAQWRAQGGLLQHGTLPLHGDLTRILHYLALSRVEREKHRHRLPERASTLQDVLGQRLSFACVAEALACGFARALNLTLVPAELGPHEVAHAEKLRCERYAYPAWTARA
jgi:lipoate-protein ligase A